MLALGTPIAVDRPALLVVIPVEGDPSYTYAGVSLDQVEEMSLRIDSDLYARSERLAAAFTEFGEALDELNKPTR